MSINTPKGPEKKEPKFDKKKPESPVQKVVDETKKKVVNIMK